jgi:hypothetical protein
MIYGGETTNSLEDLQLYVDKTVKALKPHTDAFEFIACSGISGVVVAAPVGLKLHKPVVVVRKENDVNGHHQGGEVITAKKAHGPYMIVDDFMSSGATLEYIKGKLSEHNDYYPRRRPPHCAGYYLYAYDSLSWEQAQEEKEECCEPDEPAEIPDFRADRFDNAYKQAIEAIRKYQFTYNMIGL